MSETETKPQPTTSPAEPGVNGNLLSITSILEAGAQLAAFEPPSLPVAPGCMVTIRKLPDDKFRTILNRLLDEIAPYLGGEEERRKLDGPALLDLLKKAPAIVDDLLKWATDFDDLDHAQQLPTDARLLAAAAVLSVSYLDNAGLRVFTDAVRGVSASVAAESAAAASDEQHGTDKS